MMQAHAHISLQARAANEHIHMPFQASGDDSGSLLKLHDLQGRRGPVHLQHGSHVTMLYRGNDEKSCVCLRGHGRPGI